jgi:PAS domain S-box-containing protein
MTSDNQPIELKQFLDALPIGVAVVDAQENVSYINQKAQQLLGKDIVAEMVTDNDLEIYPVYVAGTRRRYPSENQPSIRALRGESTHVDDMEIHQPNVIIPIEVWASPIIDNKQRVTHAVIVLQDITERRRLEANRQQYTAELSLLNKQLEHYSQTLEQKVIERTEELEKKTAEAIHANHAKSQFIAAASHDLRQPMQALSLFIEALNGQVTEPQARYLIEKAKQSVEMLSSLFDSLLDISRLEAGVVQPEPKNFALQTLLQYLYHEFLPQANNRNLEFQVANCTVHVRSDPLLLERILRNLLANSFKFTQRGRIEVGYTLHREVVNIFVKDTGIGIPAALQHAIFQEFYQIKSTSSSEKGLGLGLSIVKRLSELLRHPLRLESAEGRGTTFTLTVPLGYCHEILRTEPATISEIETTTARVLVIDDDALVRKALKKIMIHWGYEVVSAHSGEEALQQLQQLQFIPDIIVSDYHLRTEETGLDVIRTIQAQLQRQIPSILITGDATSESFQQLQNCGYKWLRKPVSPASLRKIITYYLRK